ncbi:MAG: hypothetical protein AAF730_17145 [Bacteroidota bacterium]
MATPVEGYVFHTYGAVHHVRYAVTSVLTLRRHDPDRPVALYCPDSHRDELVHYGLDTLFDVIRELPPEHASIVGFKLNLHRFMPFDRCLYVDADMVWCRNPDPLWQQLTAFPFTATGLDKADVFFGGPKGLGIVWDYVMDRRRRTIKHFELTHLPRVQAGVIYAQDEALTKTVCDTASYFLARRHETHFRSRLSEGRSEESCEWSMAMAMSRLSLPVFDWFQGYNSAQLDFVDGLTDWDPDFEQVTCRYYCDRFVHSLRGLPNATLRDTLIGLFSRLPGRGDYLNVTPYALHFSWLHHKEPFRAFSARTWERVTGGVTATAATPTLAVSGDGMATPSLPSPS